MKRFLSLSLIALTLALPVANPAASSSSYTSSSSSSSSSSSAMPGIKSTTARAQEFLDQNSLHLAPPVFMNQDEEEAMRAALYHLPKAHTLLSQEPVFLGHDVTHIASIFEDSHVFVESNRFTDTPSGYMPKQKLMCAWYFNKQNNRLSEISSFYVGQDFMDEVIKRNSLGQDRFNIIKISKKIIIFIDINCAKICVYNEDTKQWNTVFSFAQGSKQVFRLSTNSVATLSLTGIAQAWHLPNCLELILLMKLIDKSGTVELHDGWYTILENLAPQLKIHLPSITIKVTKRLNTSTPSKQPTKRQTLGKENTGTDYAFEETMKALFPKTVKTTKRHQAPRSSARTETLPDIESELARMFDGLSLESLLQSSSNDDDHVSNEETEIQQTTKRTDAKRDR
ncbi:hypothetical protein K2W90_02020 [Candidatus Babeliales bacterium]|nr:hypothetical protein [Candidatus Babeliales bacterium]